MKTKVEVKALAIEDKHYHATALDTENNNLYLFTRGMWHRLTTVNPESIMSMAVVVGRKVIRGRIFIEVEQ